MSVPVVFLPEAADDIAGAHAGYERQSTGLGDRFLEALRDLIDRVRDEPRLYGIFRRGVRAAPIRGFPFVVYYRERDADVLIVAVQHGRRSSRGWRGRT